MANPNNNDLERLQTILGYHFSDISLLRRALTHISVYGCVQIKDSDAYQQNAKETYERLEFLGDSILGMIVAERIYHADGDALPRKMTEIKDKVAANGALSSVARDLKIKQFAICSKRAIKDIYRSKVSADIVEAIIGAIYIDGGIDHARDFVARHIFDHHKTKNNTVNYTPENAKTLVSSWAQANDKKPNYSFKQDDDGVFHVTLKIAGHFDYSVSGPVKKEAEQNTARQFLDSWCPYPRG